ncbi:Fc.00g087750.m01.CDS01 [Cosmosporella sp. VM-42]
MTDNPTPLSTQSAVPSQTLPPAPEGPTTLKEDVAAQKVETVEEEPYTIKCICNFFDDDGNTIYCETCDTWQHIECFYPDNRDEAIREDFAHSCADCKPRPLDRQKAIQRTTQLRTAATNEGPSDKKTKRPPSKSHKKKPKPNDLPITAATAPQEASRKHHSPNDTAPPSKKPKSLHRTSQSVSSLPTKRSPSFGNGRSTAGHPPSPATTPPDLPDNFQIHHYSKSFYSLYNENDVPDVHNNSFANLQIPTKLAVWLRDPDALKADAAATRDDVFQPNPRVPELEKPKLEVQDVTRSILDNVVRWRSLKTTTPTASGDPLIELNGEIGFQAEYCANPENLWADLSSPLPFVFFHPILPLYIDTRQEGSLARYVRRSCKPNAQLDTYLSGVLEYHFWIVADRWINAHEPITLPWDFRLDARVGTRWLNLLGLSNDDSTLQNEPEVTEEEYTAISNWIDRILSEYGGCACDRGNNCAFARFHRQYLWTKKSTTAKPKKKSRKPKTQAISPTSTGHATNSRAASEGHVDDGQDGDGRSQSGSSRSKPPSRDLTPLRQGSFDQLGILTELTDRDKRKVAMVEDTFRRLEQQPPKKKKRVSDGTNGSTSSKSKSRNGSTVSQGNYVDSGAGRSKSGSPATTQSPQQEHSNSNSKIDSSNIRSRQSSAGPRQVYCDAAVQTDPVEGEWFSEPQKSPRPKKRIISLSKRLLSSRYKVRSEEETQRRQSFASQASAGTCMEIDSPVAEQRPASASTDAEVQSPPTQADVPMADVQSAPTAPAPVSTIPDGPTSSTKTKTPDLRLHLPPVPAFDNSGLAVHAATTPLSASSSITHSPLSTNLASPFAPPAVNGIAAHPSPIKKKLSLSDYTKSRMNKAAGKVAGGTAFIKPSISSPEDTKVDIIIEPNSVEKPTDHMATSTANPTTNGPLSHV